MRMLTVGLLLAMVLGLLLIVTGPASAQQYPDVSKLTPYTAEANYMSLPGYLRWQVNVERKTWITMHEAYEAVLEQSRGM